MEKKCSLLIFTFTRASFTSMYIYMYRGIFENFLLQSIFIKGVMLF